MWDQDVQDRQSLKIQVSEVRKGWVLVMIPGLFIVITHFKLLLHEKGFPAILSGGLGSEVISSLQRVAIAHLGIVDIGNLQTSMSQLCV